MSDLTLVKYQQFIDHLDTGLVSDVSIYDFSTEVEITYKFNDTDYATRGSFGANEDTLLHRTLETKSIDYTLLSEKYEGPGSSKSNLSEYTSLLIFTVPVLLVIVILVQASAIKRLTSKLPSVSNGK